MNASTRSISWHGTPDEWRALEEAVEHHCACVRTARGQVTIVCPAHDMAHSQRTLDGLMFARRMADRLRREEFEALA